MIYPLSFTRRSVLFLIAVPATLFGISTTGFSAELLLFADAGMRQPAEI